MSLRDLRARLALLGGDTKGLLERTEFEAALDSRERSISVREVKAALEQNRIGSAGAVEKADMLQLLYAYAGKGGAPAPAAAPAAAPSQAESNAPPERIALDMWSDAELAQLARERRVTPPADRAALLAALDAAARRAAANPPAALAPWLASHAQFRAAAAALPTATPLAAAVAKLDALDAAMEVRWRVLFLRSR